MPRGVAGSGQRFQKRTVIPGRVGAVCPHGLVGETASAAEFVGRLAHFGGIYGERFGVEFAPLGTDWILPPCIGAVPRVKPLHQLLARPMAAGLGVECRDAAVAEAAVGLGDAEAQIVVDPV